MDIMLPNSFYEGAQEEVTKPRKRAEMAAASYSICEASVTNQ